MSSSQFGGNSTAIRKGDGNSNYGKPVAGSKSEKRAKQAHQRISNEILELCSVIQDQGMRSSGGEDGNQQQSVIKFGRLFEIYVGISNKVVGVLLR